MDEHAVAKLRWSAQLIGGALMVAGGLVWRLGLVLNNDDLPAWGMYAVFVGMLTLIAVEGHKFFE